ncbi:hypothetical protein [Enhygromyxa salina]|uniref:hypothetical protein n=1 Tax=Enhygromyxa salina TaxID=215803 RepID=UPI0011B20CFF|nr:hypothetical protein [Enhygromyxa salina]
MTEQTREQKIWATVYERFDPEKPADKPWRVERKYSPAKEIVRELARPMGGHKRFMILGGLGSGKSTELMGIAEARSESGPVVFLDLVEHFEQRLGDIAALDRVQPWEVVLLVGLGVFAAAEERFGHKWDKQLRQGLEAAGRNFAEDKGNKGEFDLAKLASSVAALAGGALTVGTSGTGALVGAGLVAVSEVAKSFQFKIGIPGRTPRSDQDQAVRQLLEAVNALIGDLQSRHATRLTVFVDGLDRVKKRAQTEAMFVDSSLLGSLECDVVLTGPMALHWGSLRKQVRQFTTKILTNAPVIDRDDPRSWEPGGRGIDLCVEVFRRRTDDLGGMVAEPLLRKLAYYSGGRMREFVRLIRELSGPAWDDGLEQVNEAIVDRALDNLREETEAGLTQKHLDVLRRLLDNPDVLPDDGVVAEMLDLCLILPYPNESEWFFPHPLLLKIKLPKASG